LAAEPPKTLRALLEALPTREAPILDHMSDLMQKFINKGLLEFEYVHQLLWEYVQEIQHHEKQNRMNVMINLLVEAGTKLMTSKPGAKVMCAIASAATAKDRKRILKSLKGHVLESALHPSGHLYIMRICDVVDDTVSVQKSILTDLRSLKADPQYTATGELIPGSDLPPLARVAISPVGSKLLLRLLSPQKRHLEPDEEILFANQPTTSKKDPSLRRKELLLFMKSSLISMCVRYAPVLVRSNYGSKVMQEVISVLYPNSVLSALVSVMVGEQPAIEEGVEEENDEEDAEDEDEEEEADDDMDEDAEAGEGDVGAEGIDADADDEEVMEGMDEMEEDDDEDEDADDAAEEAPEAPIPVVEQLPIEEDPSAHKTLRRVLDLQGGSEESVDTEFHDEEGESGRVNVSVSLLHEIFEKQLLEQWANSSRGCFSLAHMLENAEAKAEYLPTGKQQKNSKAKAIKAAVEAGGAGDSAGAKKLLETITVAKK
jgi:hypothetical protein